MKNLQDSEIMRNFAPLERTKKVRGLFPRFSKFPRFRNFRTHSRAEMFGTFFFMVGVVYSS